MVVFRSLLLAGALVLPHGIAAANNDDGFIWIDANTRIKVKDPVIKPVGTAAGGATAPEKSPKKDEKKEKPSK